MAIPKNNDVLELRREFVEYECNSLWHECYNNMTMQDVLDDIQRREENYLKCDDLTQNEINFLRMVATWI